MEEDLKTHDIKL